MNDIVLGIRLKADGKGLVGEVRVTEKALDRLGAGAARTGMAADRMGRGFAQAERRARLLQVAVLALATGAMARVARSFLDAASTTERYRTTLKVLLGDAVAAGQVFEDMARLASRVPQEYEEILGSATALAGVVRGGRDEINQLIPIVLDISAATRLSVEETTSQIIRMYSAGAAAADLFRERGILAALGFQAGVSVSAQETMKRLIDSWKDGTSKFKGATDELAETWIGLTSMMDDKWFRFRNRVMDAAPFDFLKASLALLNEDIDRQFGSIDAAADEMGRGVVETFKEIVLGSADIVDAARPALDVIGEGVNEMIAGFNRLPDWAQAGGLLGAILFGRKGLVFLAAGSFLLEKQMQSIEALDQVFKGNLSLGEYFSLDHDEFTALMARRRVDLGAPADLKFMDVAGGENGSARQAVEGVLGRIETRMARNRSETAIRKLFETVNNLNREFAGETGPLSRVDSNIGELFDTVAKLNDEFAEERAEKHAKAVKEIRGAWLDTLPAYKAATARAADWRKEALAGLDQTAAGYEDFAATVEEVYQHRMREALEESLRDSRDWRDGVVRGLRDYADEAGNAAAQFESLTTGALRKSEDAFVEWAKTGKASAGDLFSFMADEALRMAYRIAVIEPVLGPLESVFRGLFSGGDLFGGNPNQPTSGFTGTGQMVDILHGGGIAGAPGAPQRRVPAGLFADAPRLHRGGYIRPGEVPAILEEGERVLPRGAAAGGAVTVTVVNNSGAEARVSERATGGGGRDIVVQIGEALAEDVRRGGPLGRAIGQSFNLSRAGL